MYGLRHCEKESCKVESSDVEWDSFFIVSFRILFNVHDLDCSERVTHACLSLVCRNFPRLAGFS